MRAPSCSVLESAIHALHGESNLESVRAALGDRHTVRVLAFANGVHPIIRTVAALSGEFLSLLDPQTIADPAVHDAVRSLVGMKEGFPVLWSWARVASAGWGADIADALIDAVRKETCPPGSAAALIGPCDKAASVLHRPADIAIAITRWGIATPDNPTAWMAYVSPAHTKRLCALLRRAHWALASCIPWTSMEVWAGDILKVNAISLALHAFADASPVARTQYAGVLDRIIAAAQPCNLGALTRLACVMRSDIAWTRVQALVQEFPDDAHKVVAAAPWDDLPEDVQRAILDSVNQSDVCVAVAAARGRTINAPVTEQTATAFFAALDPTVWNAIERTMQRQWLDALSECDAYLAVRSLGPCPEILARASLDDDLISAACHHATNDGSLRMQFLAIALRDVNVTEAQILISELPHMPSDPEAFVDIASGCRNADVIAPVHAALHTLADLAVAMTLRRSASRTSWVQNACMAIRSALHGRTWSEVTALLAFLGDDVRTALMPDADGIAADMASSEMRHAMRRSLDCIAVLPPEVAVPALYALGRLREHRSTAYDWDAAEGIAFSLRNHGDLFVAIVDALPDASAMRAALLPLPDNPSCAAAIRALTCDDPVRGQRLAHALRQRAWREASALLLDAPYAHAIAVLKALPNPAMLVQSLASEGCADALQTAFLRMVDRIPLTALALTTLVAHDPDERTRGVVALAENPQIARRILPLLRPDLQTSLRAHPVIAVALADLLDDAAAPSHPPGMKGRTLRRNA